MTWVPLTRASPSPASSVIGANPAFFKACAPDIRRLVEDMIESLPIPTRSEIDSLYQEVHRLKRRLRELEKK